LYDEHQRKKEQEREKWKMEMEKSSREKDEEAREKQEQKQKKQKQEEGDEITAGEQVGDRDAFENMDDGNDEVSCHSADVENNEGDIAIEIGEISDKGESIQENYVKNNPINVEINERNNGGKSLIPEQDNCEKLANETGKSTIQMT